MPHCGAHGGHHGTFQLDKRVDDGRIGFEFGRLRLDSRCGDS